MLRKAVIPAAGVGSRVLTITNGTSKELLPVNGKPLIRFSIDESLESGINHIGIVTRKEKADLNKYLHDIEDVELEIQFIYQQRLRGLGHAVRQSMEWVGDDDFAVLLPDDIITYSEPCPLQLYKFYEKYSCSIIGIEHTDDVWRYGIVKGEEINENVLKVEELIEKPNPSNTPSNMGIIGRYLLTSGIFPCIDKVEKRSPNNVELTDALQFLLRKEDVYAINIQGKRYDCGNVKGYEKAVEEIY